MSLNKIKVGDKVRLTSKGENVVEGLLEENHIYTKGYKYKVGGKWYSELWSIEKISDEVVEERVREEKTSIDEDLMNALIS